MTGRRKSQGEARAGLNVVEVDERGLIKVNPLIEWSFTQVREYIDKENVPYNPLLDEGYRSVGDWHSTAPPSSSLDAKANSNSTADDGASERAGRWQGKQKSECGLHKDYFQMKKAFEEKRREAEGVLKVNGLGVEDVVEGHEGATEVK